MKHVTAPAREMIPSLTGVRFIAAFGVVLYHLQYLKVASLRPPFEQMVLIGRDGVDLFFVLSGFVIAYNYGQWFANTLGSRGLFLWYRIARVAPLNLACLLVATPVTLFITHLHSMDSPVLIATSWLANALMIHAVVFVLLIHSWDVPSWSLSVEVFCYWLFPAFALAILNRVHSPRRLAAVAGLCWLAGAVIVCACVLAGPSAGDIAFFLPLTRVWEFFVGAILGTLRLRTGSTTRTGRDFWIAIVIIAFILVAFRPMTGPLKDQEWYLLVFPLSVALVALLAAGPSRIGNVLGHPWLIRLGDASYALYLIHWIPLSVIATVAASYLPLPFWVSISIVMLLLPLSLASYRWFETPSRRWLRAHQPVWLVERLSSDALVTATAPQN